MMNALMRKLSCVALLIAGLVAWWVLFDFESVTRAQLAGVIVAALACLLPPVRRVIATSLDRVRHPSTKARAMATFVILVLATAYLFGTALEQHRPTYPRLHDDQSYLLQTHMVAHGKLWTQPHPLGDFFETFYVLVKPVYASIYFPGTAMIYAWEVWVQAPFWIGPIIVSGLTVALTFRIVAELLDDAVLGFLAAIYVLGIVWFRYLSMMFLSHPVVMFLGLLLVWAYLHFRKRPQLRSAWLIGLIVGWAAITRPLDAFCFAVPVAIGVIWRFRGLGSGRIAKLAGIAVLGAAPFALIQGSFNHAVTGSVLHSPYHYYVNQFTPGMEYGSMHLDENARPKTTLLAKQVVYDTFIKPALFRFSKDRFHGWFGWKLKDWITGITPVRAMLVLLPVGLLGLRRRETFVLWGMIPLYIIGYAGFPFMLWEYRPIAAPAVALVAMLGFDQLVRAFPEIRNYLTSAGTLIIIVLCLGTLHEFTGTSDDPGGSEFMRVVAEDMPRIVKPPAVVLFTFNPRTDNPHEYPVYNMDVVNPDDAAVIRANDLGERNPEIFDYYAKRQPERKFYLFKRDENAIYPMGTAKEVAKKYPLSSH